MRRVAMIVLLSIAAAAASDKDKPRFAPGPASSIPGHQTLEKITIAAVPYVSDEQTRAAFDKLNPNQYGVLPILVVFENATGGTLRLNLEAQIVDPDNRHIDATPASDIARLGGVPKPPKLPGQSPNPIPLPRKPKKSPLNVPEIEGRAFVAHMLPERDSAFGFFYFQTEFRPGSRLYLTGIKDAGSGKDYFYFEVPLEKPAP
jgi:hypothetical protein